MISEKEILQNVHSMGYVTCTPRMIKPSYYKLNDGSGTIIRATIFLNHCLPNPQDPIDLEVNSHIDIAAFVPKESRMPDRYKEFQPSEIQSNLIDDDVECETLHEEFSVYDLSNGFVVSLKTVVGQISKSKLFNMAGEPIYGVRANPIFKIKKK